MFSFNDLILFEDEILSLKSNPAVAYGTTLTGALLLGNKLLVVKIGDTECIGIRKGEIIDIFDSSDDPAANVTYSMCQDDAFKYLKVKYKNLKRFHRIKDAVKEDLVNFKQIKKHSFLTNRSKYKIRKNELLGFKKTKNKYKFGQFK